MQPKARTTAARAALLLVGAIWGSSLIVVKSSTASISPALLIALRFSMAFLLLSVVFFQKYRHISKSDVGCGALIAAGADKARTRAILEPLRGGNV